MGYVYFMKPKGIKGPIKIGISSMPEYRRNVLSSWSPFDLELMAVVEDCIHPDEWRLHMMFDDFRLHQEWFLPTKDLVDGIKMINEGKTLSQAFPGFDQVKYKKRKKVDKPEGYSWEDIFMDLIPLEWQMKLVKAEPGILTFSDFEVAHKEVGQYRPQHPKGKT